MENQKKSNEKMEDAIDRNKISISNSEKIMESLSKEKDIAGINVAEVQELLLSKVAISELHSFEAKFAGYATRMEYQSLAEKVQEFSRVSDLQAIAHQLRHIESRFGEYTRTARMDEDHNELKDWVGKELDLRIKEDAVATRMAEMDMKMKTRDDEIQRTLQ